MEWIERLNSSINYMEKNMKGTIDLEEVSKIASIMNASPLGMLGVSSCNTTNNWRYYIAVASTHSINKTLEEFIVPACTWAVFSGEGHAQSIQELQKRIVTEWLPASDYEYANAPDIEVYLNADPENSKYEMWIPVIKKEI